MISRDEMVDRLLKCARRDASDARDPVSRSRRQKRLEQTGRNFQSFLPSFGAWSAPPWPALIGCTACRGSAFLQRTALAFGPLVAHWAENDAYPYLAPSQNETLRDHIWCEIHTAWDMEFRPHTHAGERTKNAASRVLFLSLLLVM